MSNFRAIATVTATLALEWVKPAAQAAVAGAEVTTVRPDSSGNAATNARANVYLYQVTPNAAWRNRDLPTRNSNGPLGQRPLVALDLYYLLTFYGDDTQLESQRMLGNVALAMQTRPVLTRDMIQNTISNPHYPYLVESNLADEVELVKFTPLPLTLEELSKIWSVFFQTQYTLSAAYQATVVLIEGEDAPRTPMPVLERQVYAVPFRHPTIELIHSSIGEREPILSDSTIMIEGKQLRGEITQLRIGGSQLMSLPDDTVTDTRIDFKLTDIQPAGSLRAGVQAVQVVQPLKLGRPPVEHSGFESNVVPLVMRPTITNQNAPDSTQVVIDTDILIGATQRVLLLLNEATANNAQAYTMLMPPRNADSNTLAIPIQAIKPAKYFVRLQVDGAESILTVDQEKDSPTFGQIIGPIVTIP